MKRHNVKELENLLANTTPGEWNEERILTIFRSSSVVRHKSVMMAQVKDESGVARSEHVRPNGVLMSMARNFAVELLDLKLHSYGQEDCSGCGDRDAEIERLKETAETESKRAILLSQSINAQHRIMERLRQEVRTRTLSEHDTVAMWMRRADSFEAEIEKLKGELAQSQETTRKALLVLHHKNGMMDIIVEDNLRLKETLRPDKTVKARELECKDCQQINFHEQCHDVQEKTAERCMAIISGFYDGHHPLGIQSRIALKIKEEFGVEDGVPCPLCQSADTVKTASVNGDQGDGQEVGVTSHLCISCRNEWSE